MSFGYKDKDWVDLDPEEEIKCGECEFWQQCPGCLTMGWCLQFNEFRQEDESC